MKPWRCYLGKHSWERREASGIKYWACAYCDKEYKDPPPKFIPPVPPGAGGDF
jgi:hypothetical protein